MARPREARNAASSRSRSQVIDPATGFLSPARAAPNPGRERPSGRIRLIRCNDLSTRTDMTETRELIIIGGGPAGYTAALYAARANLAPLVIEGFNWGGQLMVTSDVENYPGYPDGIMGPEMMSEFRRQAERFGAEFVTDDVTRVDFSERPFRVWVDNEAHQAQSVIVATGASARWLGLESEERLKGRGVSACATCDGAFFRDKHIYAVGGGRPGSQLPTGRDSRGLRLYGGARRRAISCRAGGTRGNRSGRAARAGGGLTDRTSNPPPDGGGIDRPGGPDSGRAPGEGAARARGARAPATTRAARARGRAAPDAAGARRLRVRRLSRRRRQAR